MFGGPWRYDSPHRGGPTGEDKVWLEEAWGATGAVVAGRGTYEAAPPGRQDQPPLSWRRSLGPGIVTYDGVRSMAEYRERLYLGTASFPDCAYVIEASRKP